MWLPVGEPGIIGIKVTIMITERKRLGIISGMGTRAGLLFVSKLIDRIEAPCDQDFPEFIVHNNSRIPDRTLAIVHGESSPIDELMRSIDIMHKCNVDYIVSTCVTSHHFIAMLDETLQHNILNPVDLAFDAVQQYYPGITRVGLLATTGTINSGLFHKKFKGSHFELITLGADEQESKFMKAVYMKGGLKSAAISEEAYLLFGEAVQSLTERGVEMILGGCTEVQIGLSHAGYPVPCLDIVDVLVDEVVKKMELKLRQSLITEASPLCESR